ncbi:lipopolysaccharide assembly protein LapB [Ramlibacter sp. MAHUQ-53]|uniref:lipopolysaccharide assembly protein LapB n=1 Tax=unclassified Ramlibacter TaxID=2617605 RepID=UPI00362C17FB
MESDYSWLLWAFPLAFALGWLASRLDLRQLRIHNRQAQAPKAYFRGLNFLLNEQQDQAIDAFIEAVRNDPDTSELHFALGNLFRRRGEYERAVRVHEHLLSRADLSRVDRHRAQHALALDYLKAGLLDRAEDALRKLEGTAHEEQALLALLAIYERTRDWSQAGEIAGKLTQRGYGDYSGRLAHYLCEQAATAAEGQAEPLVRKAQAIAPDAARPAIELAALQRRAGQHREAFETLATLAGSAPRAIGLVARPLAESAIAASQQARAVKILQASHEASPSLDVLDALVLLESDLAAARAWYVRHLEREPSLVAAAKWVAGEKLEHDEFHPQVQRALDHAAKPLTRYRCAACGFEANRHFWQCPGCQAWDSYPARRVEEL